MYYWLKFVEPLVKNTASVLISEIAFIFEFLVIFLIPIHFMTHNTFGVFFPHFYEKMRAVLGFYLK